jgi:hypothetical protein
MFVFRFFSVVLIIFGLMWIGADVVTILEKNGMLAFRSFAQILMLFHVDAKDWVDMNAPPQLAALLDLVISWPGWAVLGGPGLLIAMITPPTQDTKKQRANVQPPIQR